MTLAIVLAGGANSLIRLGERLTVEYVVDALQNSRFFDRVIIAGPVAESGTAESGTAESGTDGELPPLEELRQKYRAQEQITVVGGGVTPVDSFMRAYALVPLEAEQILLATGDIPLLTTEVAEYFLETCAALEGDLFYPIVPKQVNEEKYPGVERTYIKLREGVFTGGNLFLIKTRIIERCLQEATKLVNLRKSPLALASHVGWGLLWRYLTLQLTLPLVEKEVSRLLGGVKGVGVICPYPEIGIDVDKKSDVILVKKFLCV